MKHYTLGDFWIKESACIRKLLIKSENMKPSLFKNRADEEQNLISKINC